VPFEKGGQSRNAVGNHGHCLTLIKQKDSVKQREASDFN
jgi:hypothetical protein